MKRIAFVVAMTLCLNNIGILEYSSSAKSVYPANPQALTAAAIIAAGSEVVRKLNSLATSLTGDALIVTNNASAQLSAKIEEFRNLVRDEIAKPLENFSLNIQELGRQINSATERLNFILTQQQQCFFRNTENFLSGVSNITQELKQGIPLIRSGKPRLFNYKFDGHITSVVPREGGRFTISGYMLWETQNLIPTVELMDANRTVRIRTLLAQRGSDSNSISVSLDRAAIEGFIGQCLQLHVQALTRRLIFGREATDLYLPFCVPSEYATQLKVTAFINYTCPSRTERSEGREEQFLYYNESCESGRTITRDPRVWDIAPNCRIIQYRETFSRTRNTTNMALTLEPPRTISAGGSIDTADCTNLVFGRRLNASTIWEKKVIPIIECTITDPPRSNNATSSLTAMSLPTTTINVNVPKSCDSDNTVFWFTITPVINGVEGNVMYESPHVTSSRQGASTQLVTINNLAIQGSYNPHIVNGNAQVSVTISAPQCGQ